jgi:D-3-phosphoglycerate dehydrogenase
MKILISTSSFNTNSEAFILLKKKRFEVILNPYKRKLSESEIKEMLPGIDGLIAGLEPITKDVLNHADNLKVISRCGAGIDNVDLEAAKCFGIKVYSTPDAVTQAAAELTIGLMFNILRNISAGDRLIRSGAWTKQMGNLLYGKTLGILGLGRIGKKIVELLQPFGLKYLARDIAPNNEFAVKYSVRYCCLDDILREADIITIHLPYEASLDKLIGERELNLMKENAVLINASRGGLIDEDALYTALRQKRIAGAAIDAFASEPYSGKLRELDNIILTPHVGSYAREVREKMESEAVANLLTGLEGNKISR